MNAKPSARSPLLQSVNDGCDALARGDRKASRACALRAVAIDPRSEEAWLLLAALASPRTRAQYLDHLLMIHPDSEGARRALDELASPRPYASPLDDDNELPLPEEILAAIPPVAAEAPSTKKPAAARPAKRGKEKPPKQTPARPPKNIRRSAGRRSGIRWGILLLAASCLLALTATAFANVVSYAQEPPVLARVARDIGTAAPSFTPSFTPTITPSFTPTFTLTFTPSPTDTPTATPLPPTAVPFIAIPGSGGERWIDIDISSQRVTAYEGNNPIGTFIVSTGTSAHPTVIGRFRVYVKYRYDDMAGPGYYLSDVPYVMYFYEGYSIHGTYWHSNFGTPMSHGCVNMRTSDAQWMFSFASVGTVVNVHW